MNIQIQILLYSYFNLLFKYNMYMNIVIYEYVYEYSNI
jgi:hypothetical protein